MTLPSMPRLAPEERFTIRGRAETLMIGTIRSAEGVLVKAGASSVRAETTVPLQSDTRTAGTVSTLLGAESAYRFNALDLSCSSSMTRSAFLETDHSDVLAERFLVMLRVWPLSRRRRVAVSLSGR